MTGQELIDWRRLMGWSQAEAAERLGWGRRSVQRAEARPAAPVPLYIALAAAALWHRFPPWSGAGSAAGAVRRDRSWA